MSIVFLDTETTGLDDRVDEIFEVAIVEQDGTEWEFHLRPSDLAVTQMHPKAAEVNRYHERTAAPGWRWDDYKEALPLLRDLIHRRHIVGAVPDFDTRFLTAMYRRSGLDVPRWHYHLIDIEAMAVGWLHGKYGQVNPITGDSVGPPVEAEGEAVSLPWDSDDLSRACGVEPASDDERHTALGDARWVKRWYDAITGGAS